MCMSKPKIPKVETPPPAPTVVQPTDVEADNGERKEKRRGRSTTETSTDRDTILGQLSGRTTLG